jgi:hypothetical protein
MIDRNKIKFVDFDEMFLMEPMDWWREEIAFAYNSNPTSLPARVEVCDGKYQFDIDIFENKWKPGHVIAGCSAYYDYPWRIWNYFKKHAAQNAKRKDYNEMMKPIIDALRPRAEKEKW